MGKELSRINERYRKNILILGRIIPGHLMARLTDLDRTLLKGSAMISVGMLVARGLALLFYLILARVFAPGAYGEIQYSIAIAGIITIGTQPFGQHVLARFIGMHNESPNNLKRFFSNSWVILIGIFVVTLALAIPVLEFLSLQNLGILVVVAGTTIFYAYWGVARGFLASGRLVVSYLGSNLLQLILTFWLIQFVGIKSITLVLVIYGSVYLLPLVLLQIFKPLYLSFDRHLISWNDIKPILRFSFPIWLSHAMYTLNITVDILLLKHFTNVEILGQYSLAKTISTLFIFIPAGISTILMPRIASLPEEKHNKLLIQSLNFSLLINVGILAVLLLFGEWAVRQFFGVEYLSSPTTVLVISIAMIVLGIHGIFSSVQVGKGRANWETITRIAILIISIVVGWWIIPKYAGLGAAISMLAGGISGMIAYGVLYFLKWRSA